MTHMDVTYGEKCRPVGRGAVVAMCRVDPPPAFRAPDATRVFGTDASE